MFTERTAIGLDVHARSVRAAAIDTVTGEVLEARLSGRCDEVVAWVVGVRDRWESVAVGYEAGPTGFGFSAPARGGGGGVHGGGAIEDPPSGR